MAWMDPLDFWDQWYLSFCIWKGKTQQAFDLQTFSLQDLFDD